LANHGSKAFWGRFTLPGGSATIRADVMVQVPAV
jgi:hypothetical protein